MDWQQYSDRAMVFSLTETAIDPLLYGALGLSGECGEVCDKIKKIIRETQQDPTNLNLNVTQVFQLADELGDVLWFLNLLARNLGYSSLKEVAIRNIDKLEKRAKEGTLWGNGDNR